MVKLPDAFLTELRALLSEEELQLYLACFEQPVKSGLRVNTLKVSAENFEVQAPFHLARIPWTRNAFFFSQADSPTRHPWYAAGAYYIQEPSAMIPAQCLPIEPGDMVLDLCAAPGGKATEIAARLQGTGFLLANDISNSRAKALLRNLERFGVPNMAVCSEDSAKLAQCFPAAFDKVLVDAPCSGEGMFHKEPNMIADWQQRGPAYYAELQRGIILDAADMLKPGGMLLYSTCTFSRAEDESTVEWLLSQRPEFSIVPVTRYEGFAPGQPPVQEAVRVWPQRMKGEGHFVCLLQKAKAKPSQLVSEQMTPSSKESENSTCTPSAFPPEGSEKSGNPSFEEVPVAVQDFLQQLQNPRCFRAAGVWKVIHDQVLYVPAAAPWNQRVRYLRTGLLVGQLKRGRFEPAQQLAMALQPAEFTNGISLPASDQRVQSYLRGETVELLPAEERQISAGWVLVCVDNLPLGWAKAQNSALKNKLDPGWRTA